MKKLLLLMMVLGFAAQGKNYIPYYNQANEAEYQLSQGNYAKAQEIFKTLEKKYKTLLPKDDFYMGMMYYFQNDTAGGEAYVLRCAQKFGFPSATLRRFQVKYPQLRISGKVVEACDKIENELVRSQERELKDSLAKLVARHQQLLLSGASASSVVNFQKQYLDFLETHPQVIGLAYGDEYSEVFSGVHDKTLFRQYENFLLKKVKEGSMHPWFYAHMVDMNQSDEPVYNTLYKTGLSESQLEVIRKNRKKIGMSTYFKGPGHYPITNFSGTYLIINKQ